LCGRLNVVDDPFVQALCRSVGIDLGDFEYPSQRFVRAASPVHIIREVDGGRVSQKAIWWLLLEPSANGFKPSKYTSFNTRYDKLNVPRSAGYKPFRESRCIIPVKGFGETEFEYQGKRKVPKHYFDMSAIDGALALGGLCKDYVCKETGELVTGFSVITLPPHQKLKDIHSKASPLMLPQDSTLDAWLDSSQNNVEQFEHLLRPAIRQNLEATQIDKPSTYRPIGKPFVIEKD
jgi:putative SOS response-associated peptidase YedK